MTPACRQLSAFTLATLLSLIGSVSNTAVADVTAINVTYLKDIAPIFAKRCLGCHASSRGDAIALDTIERVRQSAGSIRRAVLEKRMPPWPAAAGFNEFSNDASLTAAETEVIRSWLEGRMPLGVAGASMPQSVQRHTALERPDLSIPLDATSRDPIAARRFVFRSRWNATRWMTGWAVRPASSAIREIRVQVAGTNAGTLVLPETHLSFPRGVAHRIPAGASIVIEVQYERGRAFDANSGAVEIFLGARPAAELRHRPLACGQNILDRDMAMIALTPYADRAARIEITARRPDRSVEPLIVITKYAPDYRFRYAFSRPVVLPRGTSVDLRSSDPNCRADADVSGLQVRRAR